MKEFESSVTIKGQVTIPQEVRRRWGLKPGQRVTFHVDDRAVTITPAGSLADEIYGVIPPLAHPLTDSKQTEIAAEEQAQEIAREGLASR